MQIDVQASKLPGRDREVAPNNPKQVKALENGQRSGRFMSLKAS